MITNGGDLLTITTAAGWAAMMLGAIIWRISRYDHRKADIAAARGDVKELAHHRQLAYANTAISWIMVGGGIATVVVGTIKAI